MQDDLIKRLEALHVWPQFVADDHADILSPRQSAGLYEVGNVAHEAASAGRADNARIAALEADNARLMGLVKEAGEGFEHIYHVLHCISDQTVDEGDRVYFGSTNDPHTLARMLRRMEDTLAKIKEATDA